MNFRPDRNATREGAMDTTLNPFYRIAKCL
jgi:hypothetical protein